MRHNYLLLPLAVCLAAGLAVLTPATTGAAANTGTTANQAQATEAVKPSLLDPATMKSRAPAVFKAKFTTTKGDFVIEVTRAWAPIGADRFYNLVTNGFFTDASFFRVVSRFMVQFGIPAQPNIARVWASASMKDDVRTQSNRRGYVSYAQAGTPNTRSTQMFINLVDNTFLDPQNFAPFGRVVEGMEVVDKIYSGYGEDSNQQDRIRMQGKAYLDKAFPKLDSIKGATIVAEPDKK